MQEKNVLPLLRFRLSNSELHLELNRCYSRTIFEPHPNLNVKHTVKITVSAQN